MENEGRRIKVGVGLLIRSTTTFSSTLESKGFVRVEEKEALALVLVRVLVRVREHPFRGETPHGEGAP